MAFRPPENEYLEPSVYFYLGMSVARMLRDNPNLSGTGSAQEQLIPGMALIVDIASGRVTMSDSPDEQIAKFRSMGIDTEALRKSIRTNFANDVKNEKLAASHLIEGWGWLDPLSQAGD
jgi:hypothetical protein